VPHVNLWELITTVAGKDLSNSDSCKAIQADLSPRFGTELSLEIEERGIWVIDVFDHENPEQKVRMTIQPDGFLTVTRCRRIGDVFERRTVEF
jgi:hypothetical protein